MPLSSAEFTKACQSALRKDHLADINAILDGHPEEARHPAIRWYVARETQLRSALARARAQRAGVDPQRHVREYSGYDARTDEIVAQAMSAADPLERALLLDRHRWWLLDQMAGPELFSPAAVFSYALKLLLAERLQSLAEAEGVAVAEHIVHGNLAGLSL